MNEKMEVGQVRTTFVKPGAEGQLSVWSDAVGCRSITIMDTKTYVPVNCPVDRQDVVPLALAVLSGGRLSEDIEEMAVGLADSLGVDSFAQGRIDQAMIQLRALVLLRERAVAEREAQQKASEKKMRDAYALYLLAHEDGAEVFESVEEFVRSDERLTWSNKLRSLRGEVVL